MSTEILGDCFEVMSLFNDKSVDHVITDPPYSQLTHANAKTLRHSVLKEKGIEEKNQLITFDNADSEYFWLQLLNAYARLVRRWIIMTVDWRHAGHIEYLCNAKIVNLDFVRLGMWDKLESGTPQLTGDRPAVGWEAVAMLHAPGKKRWNKTHKTSVYRIQGMIGKSIHPTQKPEALINQFILDFTDIGETILDPFMGSGTTGVCAAGLGRQFIGIEKDQKYYDIAKARINRLLFV